jgi:choline dehydrogenase-like flavoprotein
MLSIEFDIFTIREAVKTARRLMSSKSWKTLIIGPVGGLANVTTDEAIEQYARKNAATIFHPACTARMTARDSEDGVVNPDFTIKKTAGIRIVDASVFVSRTLNFCGLYVT